MKALFCVTCLFVMFNCGGTACWWQPAASEPFPLCLLLDRERINVLWGGKWEVWQKLLENFTLCALNWSSGALGNKWEKGPRPLKELLDIPPSGWLLQCCSVNLPKGCAVLAGLCVLHLTGAFCCSNCLPQHGVASPKVMIAGLSLKG